MNMGMQPTTSSGTTWGDETLLTVTDVARLLQLRPTTIYAWAASGAISLCSSRGVAYVF